VSVAKRSRSASADVSSGLSVVASWTAKRAVSASISGQLETQLFATVAYSLFVHMDAALSLRSGWGNRQRFVQSDVKAPVSILNVKAPRAITKVKAPTTEVQIT
jgi:hypothetical protein